MYHDEFSTQIHQPRQAREITIHVRALEHQHTLASYFARAGGSPRLVEALKALPHRVRLLLATL